MTTSTFSVNDYDPKVETNSPKVEIPKFDDFMDSKDVPRAVERPHFVQSPAISTENAGKDIQVPINNTINRAEADFFGVDKLNKYSEGQLNRKFTLVQKWVSERSLYQTVVKINEERLSTSHDFSMKLYSAAVQFKLSFMSEIMTGKLHMVKIESRAQVASFASHRLQEVSRAISAGLRGYIQQHREDYAFCETLKGLPTYKTYMEYLMTEESKLFKYFDAILDNFIQAVTEKIKRYDQ